ncbi:MAG TPA: pyridoxal-phosphate dependent enzyme [Candidatus Saccharimonadales bacterium]|nr:pyridoxal-phosphate dependent enzyme [Candidatus Saccharimonadales bacterium]
MYHRTHPNPELHEFPMPPELEGVDFVDLASRAHDRLAGAADSIPLERSETLSYGDNEVYLYRADRFPGGNFKFVSATNTAAELIEAGHTDFTFATAGSYGIAMAIALKKYGGRGTAITPSNPNQEKREFMEELGVSVKEYGDNFDQADEYARQYAAEHGATNVHPFASRSNLAGTGAIGLELAERFPGMTDLVLQYGGGSLFGGVGSVVKELRPAVRLHAAQVQGCSPFVNALRDGEARPVEDRSSHIMPSWFARLGGVGVGRTHPFTLGVGSRLADSADTVTSGSVLATMYDVQQEHGVLPELAGAVGAEKARKLARSRNVAGATIVAVLTGNHADDYRQGYLARKSGRRREEERMPSDMA